MPQKPRNPAKDAGLCCYLAGKCTGRACLANRAPEIFGCHLGQNASSRQKCCKEKVPVSQFLTKFFTESHFPAPNSTLHNSVDQPFLTSAQKNLGCIPGVTKKQIFKRL